MHAFRLIYAHPGAPAMSAAAFVGRFPMGMLGLAMTLLVVAESGSYAVAGAVAASITLAGAVGGPMGARLADRFGQRRVIPPLIALHLTATAVLTLAVMAGAPTVSWIALGATAGLTGPNLGAMVRTRWAAVATDPRELSSAFAVESTLDEVAFVVGPPLATALAVAVAPWSAIATGLVLAGAGALWLAAQRSTEPAPAPRTSNGGPPTWRSRTLGVLSLVMLLMGAIFGALEVSTVAFAHEAGSVTATGWLLGGFALASGLTGLYLGARPGAWRLSGQIAVGSLMLALTTAALPLIDSVPAYGAGMFAAGLGVSAVMIAVMQVIERALPRARLTESLALAISGVLIGSAIAVALAGALIDAGGSAWGMAVGSTSAALGLLVVLASRAHLARAETMVERDGSVRPTPAITAEPVAVPEPTDAGTAPPG